MKGKRTRDSRSEGSRPRITPGMRVLGSVQRLDSEHRTDTWGIIAGLLAHFSRRAMTPVSAGVKIITDYLDGNG